MMDTSQPNRDPEEIQRDLAQARQRLSDNVGTLINEVHPKAVARRTMADVKTTALEKLQQLKSQFKDEDGWRTDRIVAVAGSAIGVLTFVGIIRGVRR